jgi:hypothetical protein
MAQGERRTARRANETPEQAEARRAHDRDRARIRRQDEAVREQERSARLRRQNEDAVQAEIRRQANRNAMAFARSQESVEQTLLRQFGNSWWANNQFRKIEDFRMPAFNYPPIERLEQSVFRSIGAKDDECQYCGTMNY